MDCIFDIIQLLMIHDGNNCCLVNEVHLTYGILLISSFFLVFCLKFLFRFLSRVLLDLHTDRFALKFYVVWSFHLDLAYLQLFSIRNETTRIENSSCLKEDDCCCTQRVFLVIKYE